MRLPAPLDRGVHVQDLGVAAAGAHPQAAGVPVLGRGQRRRLVAGRLLDHAREGLAQVHGAGPAERVAGLVDDEAGREVVLAEVAEVQRHRGEADRGRAGRGDQVDPREATPEPGPEPLGDRLHARQQVVLGQDLAERGCDHPRLVGREAYADHVGDPGEHRGDRRAAGVGRSQAKQPVLPPARRGPAARGPGLGPDPHQPVDERVDRRRRDVGAVGEGPLQQPSEGVAGARDHPRQPTLGARRGSCEARTIRSKLTSWTWTTRAVWALTADPTLSRQLLLAVPKTGDTP